MIDFKALSAPFHPSAISWRIGSTTQDKSKGMALAYLDARAVMDRLDEVCGSTGWQCRYPHAGQKTVCEIGIFVGVDVANPNTVPAAEWVWKADGAGDSDIEAEKGALSDAFKRAGVRWGIGRYLYDLESPWVELEAKGRSHVIKTSEKKRLDQILRQKTQAILNPVSYVAASAASSIDLAKDDIARAVTAGTQAPAPKAKPKMTPKEWADSAISVLGMCATLEAVDLWWRTNDAALQALQEKAEAEYERVALCANDARASLRAHL